MTCQNDSVGDFERETLSAFHFLVSEFRYRIDASTTRSTVKYVSDIVCIRIDYEYGFEIEVTLALIDDPRTAVPLRQLVALGGGELQPLIQASTVERLRTYLPLLAARLRQFGGDALRGNRAAFDMLRRCEHTEAITTTLDFAQRQGRRKAERAWSNRDYESVVTLLEALPSRSPAEDKRLAYAREQLGFGVDPLESH
jgi:hypothetical protein